MQQQLTEKQANILSFFIDCIQKYGKSPTLMQVAKFIGSKNPHTGESALEALWKKGYLVRNPISERYSGYRLNPEMFTIKVTRIKEAK